MEPLQQLKESIALSVDSSLSIWPRFAPQDPDSMTEDPREWRVKWKCKIFLGDKEIINADYFTGIGHLRIKQKNYGRMTAHEAEQIKTALCDEDAGHLRVKPSLDDVMYCLVMDSDVLDYGSFEGWADSLGYDSDSRKAEEAYRQCLENSLKLQSGLRHDLLQKIRESFIDY